MAKRRRSSRRRSSFRRTSKKPIGYAKVKGGYALVYGSKKKPKVSGRKFKTKTGLAKHVRKMFSRRR